MRSPGGFCDQRQEASRATFRRERRAGPRCPDRDKAITVTVDHQIQPFEHHNPKEDLLSEYHRVHFGFAP